MCREDEAAFGLEGDADDFATVGALWCVAAGNAGARSSSSRTTTGSRSSPSPVASRESSPRQRFARPASSTFTVHLLTRYFRRANLIPFGIYCVLFGLAMIGYNA